MKKPAMMAVLIIAILGISTMAQAFRCGAYNKYLATEGMHKHQIENDCGPPAIKEDVGIDKRTGELRVIEEWLYIIEDGINKYMYLIKFNRNGIAEKIEYLGEQK